MAPLISRDEEDSSGDESSHSSSSEASGRSGGGGSPARSRSESRSRSRSRSSGRSGSKSVGSKSPGSHHSRSRSRSASSYVSGAGSNAGSNVVEKDKGGDSSGSERSGRGSPSRSRSRSGSSERSGTPGSHHSRSRSRSASGNESDTVGKVDKENKKPIRESSSERSGAPSPARSRSRSRSGSEHSGTKSPASRRSRTSRSRSHSENESAVGSVLEEPKVASSEPPADSTQLFGDADDISDDDDDDSDGERERKKESDAKAKTDEEDKEDKKSDDDDEERKESRDEAEADEPEAMEVEEDPLPETRIDVEIPKITTDLGKGIHFVKLPNFLSVETRPFDPNTYEDEIDEEETLDEEGRARLKLKVENTIRWRERFNEKGVFVKESNARFVKWSDGSLSLHLGSEIFNVHKQPLQGDHNHLFIRQGTGLQGQAVFRTKLTFRPHSTESFTHRKMTMSLADRSQKTSGIKVLSMVGHDPEAQRFQMIKKEEDKLRASVRRENKQRRVRERATSRGLTSSYLEPDRYDNDEFSDEDNTISLSAIKNRYKKNAKLHSNIYSSEDEDEADDEEGVRVGKKSERPKRLKDSDEESDADDKNRDASPPGKDDDANSGSNSD